MVNVKQFVCPSARAQAALAHARYGRSVLPVYWFRSGRCGCGRVDCHSPAKHPIPELVPRGVKHATTSRIVIRAWWQHAPFANPAIATGDVSGIVVLDIDGDRAGFESIHQLEHEHGTLPLTPRVRTASGEHLYFAYPGTHLKNSAGKLGPGLDIRCCGGYVVAAGAVHKTGHTYAWVEGCRPDQVALAKPPNWLVQQLTTQPPRPRIVPPTSPRAYATAALASEERELLSASAGQRNTRLNLAAFRLARFVATEALARGDVEAVLLDVAARLGISQREAEATIASGLRAGMNRTSSVG